MRSRRAVLSAALTLVTCSLPTWAAWAAAGGEAAEAAGPLPRWPMIVVGLILALVALIVSRPRQLWEKLSMPWRVARVAAVLVGCVGVLMAFFATTEAPPLAAGDAGLPWIHDDWEQADEARRSRGQPVLIDFTADWCTACHELEEEVFQADGVRQRLARDFVLLKVDLDRRKPQIDALRTRFEVQGLPRIAFVSADGRYLRQVSFWGKIPREAFEAKLDQAGQAAGDGDGPVVSDDSDIGRALQDEGLLYVLLLVFGAGVLSSFTPCVYPLIPITVSVFGARQASSRLEGFTLSLTYVAGIAVTYSILGVAAASFGTIFGRAMQSPVVLAVVAVVFVALALSSFGLFTFQLPGKMQDLLGRVGRAGYLGALLMGLFAGLLAAPCVGPIVTGILLYVAQQQDLLLGWLLLTSFALGMGMLFLVLGTSSSLIAKMPRSGSWLQAIKGIFGVVFLAMAIYYLRFAVPAIATGLDALWVMLAGGGAG